MVESVGILGIGELAKRDSKLNSKILNAGKNKV